MHIVIFGLTLSSSWGNGHATLWRGLLRALAERGHTALFYERDVPYYANTRDLWPTPPGVCLQLYASLEELGAQAERELLKADVAIVTSFCPEGAAISRLVLDSRAGMKVFYDLDTPVTLNALNAPGSVSYLPAEGLGAFDLVLSYTGGRALTELKARLGARNVAALYGWVDPDAHRPQQAVDEFRAELSYLGTFAADRQAALEELFVKPAQVWSNARFVIGGAQYPDAFPWSSNIHFVRHLPPAQHPAFFSSCRATLNVTRSVMAAYGYCPSGRLFEAAACGAAILTDIWEGLDAFFDPGRELLLVASADDVLTFLSLTDAELQHIAQAGRARVLEEHTASARAVTFEKILSSSAQLSLEAALKQ